MAIPYFPGITTTPVLGLSLIGMDEVIAQNFITLDSAVGSGGGGGGTPALPFTSVQFNDSGAFGGNSGFTFDKTVPRFTVSGPSPSIAVDYVHFGPSESVLNPAIQGELPSSVFITSLNMPFPNYAVMSIEQEDGAGSSYKVSYGAAQIPGVGGGATVETTIRTIDISGPITGGTDNYVGYFAHNNPGAHSTHSFYSGFNLGISGGQIGQIYGVLFSDFSVYSATNPYYYWFDSRGVRSTREDNTHNSVGQAIESLYNPVFTQYTPGASNFERVVLGQWDTNVAQIGTQAGGTGTLRGLKLIGSGVGIGANCVPGACSSFFSPNFSTVLDVETTNTDTVSTTLASTVFNTFVNPASASATQIFNVWNELDIPATNAQNLAGEHWVNFNEADHEGSGTVGTLGAVDGECDLDGNGTITVGLGVNAQVNNFGSGTIVNGRALTGQITIQSTGNITTGIGLFIPSPEFLGSGVISSYYGIFVSDVTTGGAQNLIPIGIRVQKGLVSIGGADLYGIELNGTTSGAIEIKTQTASGSYNFNLPITEGNAGQVLTSQGGGATAMTWTTPSTPTVATVHLTGQTASIGSTTLYAVTPSDTISISYYLKITTAGSTSGSVTLTLGWTDRDDSTVLSVVIPTPANAVDITGVVSGTLIVDAKTGTNITYATTYASIGGTAMVYKLSMKVEAL